MTKNSFPFISPYEDDYQLRIKANEIRNGKMNCTGSFTVSSGTASTVVTDKRVTGDSVVLFTPTNSLAATSNNIRLVSQVADTNATPGTFTLEHSSEGSDRTYVYIIIG